MSDITPLVDKGSQVIHSYGAGGFKISGTRYDGSVLVTPKRVNAWCVRQMSELTAESFDAVLDLEVPVDLIFVGCGGTILPLPKGLRQTLRQRGVVLELMDTGAACRTYNITMAEGRSIAAALIAIP